MSEAAQLEVQGWKPVQQVKLLVKLRAKLQGMRLAMQFPVQQKALQPVRLVPLAVPWAVR